MEERWSQGRDLFLKWERLACWLEGWLFEGKPSFQMGRKYCLRDRKEGGGQQILRGGRKRKERHTHWVIHLFIQKIFNDLQIVSLALPSQLFKIHLIVITPHEEHAISSFVYRRGDF